MQWMLVLSVALFISFPSLASKPKLAVVIDDLGYRAMPKAISQLPPEISIAIIPFTQFDKAVAKAAKAQDREVLLHLPMQSPSGPQERSTLKISMNKRQIQSQIERALYRLPNVVAVNNHMGSLYTQSAKHMGWVMETLHAKRLGFLDSRTSSHTVGQKMAKHHGIATNRRHVFLDHHRNQKYIQKQLLLAVKKAKRNGIAIAIAHPARETLQVLKNNLEFLQQEVELIPISHALLYKPNTIKNAPTHYVNQRH